MGVSPLSSQVIRRDMKEYSKDYQQKVNADIEGIMQEMALQQGLDFDKLDEGQKRMLREQAVSKLLASERFGGN
jgi:hypothetical protein